MEDKPNAPRNNTPPKTPAWVKAFFIVILVLIVIVIIAHLLGLRVDHRGVSGVSSLVINQINVQQII
jgi:hypothetical protein